MKLSKVFEKVILGHTYPVTTKDGRGDYRLGFVDYETQERVFSYGAIVRLAQALEEATNVEQNSRDPDEGQRPQVQDSS